MSSPRRNGPLILLAAATPLLAACTGGGLDGLTGGGMVAGYEPANAVLPVGYSDAQIDDTHYKVRAHGTERTPPDRLEKIALVRAAEIGVANRLPYFKVTASTPSIDCGKKRDSYKAGSTAASLHPMLTLEVSYSKTPLPDHRSSEDTFAQMKAELDADSPAPEARAAATQDTRARCGVT